MLIKKVFFYYGDITEGIFDSQVLHHICLMKKYGHEFILINFISLRVILEKFFILKKKINFIKKRKIKCIYLLTFNPDTPHGRILNIIYSFLLSILFNIYNLSGYYMIMHARGMYATLIGVNIKKIGVDCRLIFDMRAERVSEYKYQFISNDKANLKSNYLFDIDNNQSRAFKNCDVCLMVSNALKKYMVEKYKFTPNNYYIIPSVGRSDIFFFDSNIRSYMRKSLGWENKFVIGYSGSMNPWQRIDKLFEMFVYISEMLKNTVLLILTKERSQAEKFLKKNGKESSIIIKSIEYEALGKYLNCFDVGVILRDKLLLNNVASPTKFAEYILCGVPVFISTGIGDLENVVRKQNLGICVDNIDDKDEFRKKIREFLYCNFDRNAIARYAKNKYCREAYINIYNEIYANPIKMK